MREQVLIQRAWDPAVKPVNSTGLHSIIGFLVEGRKGEVGGRGLEEEALFCCPRSVYMEKWGMFVVAAIPTESKTKP